MENVDSSFVEDNEEELQTLAEALVERNGAEVAGAGAALLAKVFTGSSVLAGAAEKATIKAFGAWLADTPDARLQRAAEACQKDDEKRDTLHAFAALVQQTIAQALRSIECSLARLERDHRGLHKQSVGASKLANDDLEVLIGQSLRSTAGIAFGQSEIKTSIERLAVKLDEYASSGAAPSELTSPIKCIWNVPFRSTRFFTGRDELLDELRRTLQAGQPSVVSLHGLGGIGKTQLAVEYASAHSADYQAVLWVAADTQEALRSNVAALCDSDALNLPERADEDQTKRLHAVLRWLLNHHRWLLVFDSADTEGAVSAVVELQQRLPLCHIIVTSRRAVWPADFVMMAVPKLPPEVGSQFLRARTAFANLSATGTERAALDVVRELDGMPLALEQAAAYVAHKRITFDDYLTRIADALHHPILGGPADKKSVFTTLSVTDEHLGPEARVLLRLLCWLSADPIPRTLFLADGGAAFREALLLMRVRIAPSEVEAAVDRGILQLADYSLVDLGLHDFTCHRLVATVQRERITNSQESQRGRIFGWWPWRRTARDESRRWLEYTLRVLTFATNYDQFDVRSASIFRTMQQHLSELVAKADTAGLKATTSILMSRLGGFLQTQARYQEALPLLRRALELDEQDFTREHPQVSIRLHNLALVLVKLDRLGEAEPLFRRALAIDEACYGLHHPQVATDLHSLAQLLASTKQLSEAEKKFRRALAIDESLLDAMHPRIALRLNSLAQILEATSRFEESEALFRRALTIAEQALGSDHPDVASTLNNLGWLLYRMDEHAEAESKLRRALAISEAVHGPAHPETAVMLNNLAQLLHDKNWLGESEALMRRALEIDEAVLGPVHTSVARDLHNLAILLRDMGRWSEGEPLLRRSQEILAARR
jgi:tetratricopeptide (TPR) repeat protein